MLKHRGMSQTRLLPGCALALLTALAPGCAGQVDTTAQDATSGAEKIAPSDDPRKLLGLPDSLGSLSFQLSDLVGAADVDSTFGVDDAHIPYPDTYWPMVSGGIDAAWSGADAPLTKYLTLAAPASLDEGKAWERAHHGADVPGVQDWWGHCPGWTGAALKNAPLKHGIDVTAHAGTVAACTAGEAGCMRFEIGDINALEAEVYVDAQQRFIGNRCDTAAADIKRDEYGRIIRTGGGCQGLNAGALLVVLGNVMRGRHSGFAIDAQNDANTDQIWNQPAYRYTVHRYEPMSASEAANLVAHGSKDGPASSYIWNKSAKGFVMIDLGILWVAENGPNVEPVSGLDSTHEMRMVVVIELDRDPASAGAKVTGGEYVDDATVGATRLTTPPFVWMPGDAGPENLSKSVTGKNHNPYVKPSIVKQLVALAQQ